MSYWSITLVEPLKRLFEQLIAHIDDKRDPNEQNAFEYKLFLMCSVLANEDFVSFNQFRQLVEKSKSEDLSLFAVLFTHYRNIKRYIPQEMAINEDLQWIEKKLIKKARSLGDIAPYVNIPINKQIENNNDAEEK